MQNTTQSYQEVVENYILESIETLDLQLSKAEIEALVTSARKRISTILEFLKDVKSSKFSTDLDVKAQAEIAVQELVRKQNYEQYRKLMEALNLSPCKLDEFGKQYHIKDYRWAKCHQSFNVMMRERPTIEANFLSLTGKALVKGNRVVVNPKSDHPLNGTIANIDSSCILTIQLDNTKRTIEVPPGNCEKQ